MDASRKCAGEFVAHLVQYASLAWDARRPAARVAPAKGGGLRQHVLAVHGLRVLFVSGFFFVFAPELCSRAHQLRLRRIEVTRFKASVFECVLYEAIVLG